MSYFSMNKVILKGGEGYVYADGEDSGKHAKGNVQGA